MTAEKLSSLQIIDAMRSDGAIFYPQRELLTPRISDSQLNVLVKEEDLKYFKDCVHNLYAFLNGQAVCDPCGSNDHFRNKWQADMAYKYKEFFRKIFGGKNQFRTSSLGLVKSSIIDLCGLLKEEGLSNKIRDIYQEMMRSYDGKDPKTDERIRLTYEELESPEERLTIVHFFEDQIVEVLTLLTTSAKS